MFAEGGDKLHQIGFTPGLIDVKLLKEVGEHLMERLAILEQLPDAGADGIEAEIDAGVEVEEHGFAGEVFEEDALGDRDLSV